MIRIPGKLLGFENPISYLKISYLLGGCSGGDDAYVLAGGDRGGAAPGASWWIRGIYRRIGVLGPLGVS